MPCLQNEGLIRKSKLLSDYISPVTSIRKLAMSQWAFFSGNVSSVVYLTFGLAYPESLPCC